MIEQVYHATIIA